MGRDPSRSPTGLDIVVAGDDTTLRSCEVRAAQTARETARLGVGLARARLVETGGMWAPTVVLSTTPLPEAFGAPVVELAERGAGIVAVAPGLPGGRALTVTDGTVGLLGETVRPHAAGPDVLAGIGALVACAAAGGDVAVGDLPYDALERPEASAVVGVPDGPELWLLGPAVLHGHDGPQPRPRVHELLAYVSEHPAGVTSDRIIDALWGGRPRAQKTLNNLMSEARRVLGTSPDGTGPLSASGSRWTTIDSDITRFRASSPPGPTTGRSPWSGAGPSRASVRLSGSCARATPPTSRAWWSTWRCAVRAATSTRATSPAWRPPARRAAGGPLGGAPLCPAHAGGPARRGHHEGAEAPRRAVRRRGGRRRAPTTTSTLVPRSSIGAC